MTEQSGDTERGDGPGFAAAIDELTALVAELESDSLDVDHLADRVQRAAELVVRCRERLDVARFQVDEVLVELDDAELDDADGEGDDDGDGDEPPAGG